jgi:hypothetical protein
VVNCPGSTALYRGILRKSNDPEINAEMAEHLDNIKKVWLWF